MGDPLARLDAREQAELVRRREASPTELVEAAIRRIEALNPKLNAVIHERFDEARREAEKAPNGPFRGVPILLKDLIDTSAGDPHHCGMKALRNAGWKEERDSNLVEKFRQAGFVVVGKTNTPELGLNVTTEPDAYGPTRNPWNPKHSSGGSSGGSAAAVASGMVPVGHANDGGGSIRIPASECGLVGLKPSRGRISLGPRFGENWSGLAISHVVTRSVADSAAILDTVQGPMPGDPYSAPTPRRAYLDEAGADAGRLRIGVLTRFRGEKLHPDCDTAVRETAKLLEAAGHRIEEACPEALGEEDFDDRFMEIVGAWTAFDLDEWGRRIGRDIGREDVEPGTWLVAETGRGQTAPAFAAALAWRDAYTRRMAAWWASGFDLLLTPTLGAPPPRLGELKPPADDPMAGMEKILELIPFTPAFNVTGQPAISLPLHWNEAGLPIGVQLVAAYGREDLLVRVASQLEQAKPWKERVPAIHA